MKKFKWLIVIISAFGFILIWRIISPTKIIAVHHKEYPDSYDIIVKNLPLTDRGKIKWWEENKEQMKKDYNLPIGKEKYDINFFVGDYKENRGTDEDSNLYCFLDMPQKDNCIEKGNQPLTILRVHGKDETIYLLNNWKVKYIKNDKKTAIHKID